MTIWVFCWYNAYGELKLKIIKREKVLDQTISKFEKLGHWYSFKKVEVVIE